MPDEPTPPEILPDQLWTLRYDYGSVFSHGPIGQEVPWVFADREHAEEAIAEAQEVQPGCGPLTVDRVTLDELGERFSFAVFVDAEGQPWPLLTSQLAQPEDTPLPDEPFALFVKGGGIDRYHEAAREGDWVVHRDDDTDKDYVLFFEDRDTAEQVRAEFEAARDQPAEVLRTRADTLTDDQGVRYYHANGYVEDLTRAEYLRRCR